MSVHELESLTGVSGVHVFLVLWKAERALQAYAEKRISELLVGVMIGAVSTHLFIVGGSPLMAIILLVVTGVVAWGRRQRTMNVLNLDRVL